MLSFEEQFNNYKKELAKILGIDELPCEIVDKFFTNYEEEYNKLLEKLWEIK